MSHEMFEAAMARTRVEGVLRRTHGLHVYVDTRQMVAYFLAYRARQLGKH